MAQFREVVAQLRQEPGFQWYRARWCVEHGQSERALHAYIAQLFGRRAGLSTAECVQFLLRVFERAERDTMPPARSDTRVI